MPFWNNPTQLQPKRAFRWVISFLDMEEQGGRVRDFKFFAKSVEKPSYDVGVQEAKYLYSHTFRFPKRVVWKPINIVFYDTAIVNYGINVYSKNYNLVVDEIANAQTKNQVQIFKKYKEANDTFLENIFEVSSGQDGLTTQKFFYDFIKKSGYNNTIDSSSPFMKSYTFKDNLKKQFSLKNLNSIKIEEYPEDATAGPLETWILNNPLITNVVFDKLDYSSEEILKITVTLNYDSAELTIKEGAEQTKKVYRQLEKTATIIEERTIIGEASEPEEKPKIVVVTKPEEKQKTELPDIGSNTDISLPERFRAAFRRPR